MRTRAMIGTVLMSGEQCSVCGTSYAKCTSMVLDLARPRPCCGNCGFMDTHDERVLTEPSAKPLQWRISDDDQAVVVWPKDLPSIAKQEAFEVTITKDELVMLWERLDRRSKGYDDDRTGGL